MQNDDLLYQLALRRVPYIGPVQARILTEKFDNARAIFEAGNRELEQTEGIGAVRARSIRQFNDFSVAEQELNFIEKYKIRPLFLTHPDYPQRLLHCYDPPTLLFYRGQANLNQSRMVAIIGTRSHTGYGKKLTEALVAVLRDFDATIISGLALGIDAIAHKAALQHQLPTIGVLAHGLASIYPPAHASLARDMIKEGGLLTEFESMEPADRHHFPTRNRIVAGLADAVVVVETGVKGGSMITAELANGYNRDVFAFPGKVTDTKSMGCNALIGSNKAILLNRPEELPEILGWTDTSPIKPAPKQLFADLSEDELRITSLIGEQEIIHIDALQLQSGLSNSAVAAAILQLEFKSVIKALPGKRYQLT